MIDIAPISARHFAMVNKLNTLLVAAVGKDGIVSIQNPVVLLPRNEPQPDLAILKPRSDYYKNQLPNAEDILLLIEVADTTLEYDRDAKIPTYAQHAIPEVWLVNVQTNSLSVFLEPSPKGYRRLLTPQAGEAATDLGERLRRAKERAITAKSVTTIEVANLAPEKSGKAF